MLGNGVCNSACNTPECVFDKDDCRCKSDCFYADFPSCKVSCLVPACNYANHGSEGGCEDEFLLALTWAAQALAASFTAQFSMTACQLSDPLCTVQKLQTSWDLQACHGPLDDDDGVCQTKECAFGLGFCMHSLDLSCVRGFGKSALECFQCKAGYVRLFSMCLVHCPRKYEASRDGVCVPRKDTSTMDAPGLIYAAHSKAEGQGSLDQPYGTMGLAMMAFWEKYTTVYLLGHQVMLALNSSSVNPEVLAGKHSPPTGFSFVRITSLTCAMLLTERCSPSYTELNIIHPLSLTVNYTLLFERVILTSEALFEGLSVEFCPNLLLVDGVWRLDNGQQASSDHITAAGLCTAFHDYSVIIIEKGGVVTFREVEISALAIQARAVVKILEGDLVFESVHIADVHTLRSQYEGGVVLQNRNCPGLVCGSFTFTNGSVRRMNNGLKYVEGLLLTPFLYGVYMSRVLISNVMFEHNLVVDTLASSEKLSRTALLYLDTFYNLTLTNCTFHANFVTGGLLVVSSTVVLPKLFDAHNVAYMYTYTHITLTHLLLDSNLGECSLITIYFQRDVLNVNISQMWLADNAVEGYALLAIQSDRAASSALVWGEVRTVISPTDGTKEKLWIAPRYVSIANVTITKTMSATSHLIIENCANINLTSLSLAENGDFDADVLNKTFQAYMSDPGAFPPQFPAPSACAHFIYLHGNIQLSLQHINLTANHCNQGICGVFITNASDNVSVSDFTARDNFCTSSSGSALTTLEGMSVQVLRVTAVNNTNWGGGVFSFGAEAEIVLQDSLFQDNVGVNGAAVACQAVRSLAAARLSFRNNSAKGSAGGGLYIRTGSSDASHFLLSACEFEGNTAEKGGALAFQPSNDVPVVLHLSSCNFRHNSATAYGAALLLDVGLTLQAGSSIEDCHFAQHTSDYGVLSLSYKKGALAISKSSFHSNSGRNAAVVFLQTESPTQTTFTEVQFTDNYGATTLLKASSRFNSSISTRNCVFRGNEKADIVMEGGCWQDWNTTFSVSRETEFLLSAGAVAVLTSTTVRDNYDRYQGGAVHLLTGAVLHCEGCLFLNNSAGHSGGAIFAEQDSTVVLRNSVFRFNRAIQNGAVLQLISSLEATSLIESSLIELNSVGKLGTIFTQSSSLTLSNVTLRSNEGPECPGVVLMISALQIYNSRFSAQSGGQAAFLLALTSSNVSIAMSHFWEGVTKDGGSVSLVSSVLTMTDTSLKALHGGAIFANDYCYVILSRVQATDVTLTLAGSLVNALYSTLLVSNCDFSHFRLVGIYGFEMFEVVIEDSSFAWGEGKLGGAFLCYQCLKVRIEQTVFADLKAEVGGAVSLWAQDSSFQGLMTVTDSGFMRNSAEMGGALWASNYQVHITDSVFEENRASQGGAVKLDCVAATMCNFSLSFSNFRKNSAEVQGGGIVWSAVKPHLINLTFADNAAPYGPDVASYPIRLVLDSTPRRLLPLISNYPPGQLTNTAIRFSVQDHYGQVYRIDNTSVVVLSAVNVNSTILGTFKVTAVQGYFVFDAFVVYGQPGSLVNVMASSEVGAQQAGNPYEHISSIVLPFELRECIPGEARTLYSCEKCVAGTYSFEPSTPCLTCLANAQCWGNFTVTPDAGYWRSSVLSPVIRACLNPKACLGGVVDGQPLNLTGLCEVGYQGNLCQPCQSSYSHTDKNVCGKCPEPSTNAVRLAFLALALVLVQALMVWLTLRASVRPKAEHSILIKIMTNYLQLVTLVVGFKLKWPKAVESTFFAQNAVGEASEQLFSFDCLIGANGSQADVYYWKIVIMALMPLLLIAASVLFWAAVAWKKRNWRLMRQECVATIVIIFFLIEPNLVDSLFSLFSCQEIEAGEYWLTVDLSIKCWDHTHTLYMLALGLPGIVVWVFGVPLGCLCVLTRYRRRQDEVWMKMQYGFLMCKYRRHCFYWEFVILYRKVLIIICAVFMTNSIPQQALTIQVILLIAFFLQLHVEPYTTSQLNQIETLAILVADVTIYCGLYYLTLQLSLTAAWLLFILIVTANVAFLLAWLRALVRSTWSTVSRSLPALGFLLRPDYCYDEDIERCIKQNRKGNTPEVAAFHMNLVLSMRQMLRQQLPLLSLITSPRYTPRIVAAFDVTSLLSENQRRRQSAV